VVRSTAGAVRGPSSLAGSVRTCRGPRMPLHAYGSTASETWLHRAGSNDYGDTLTWCLAQTMLPEGFRQGWFGACCGRLSYFLDRSAYSSPSSTVATSRGFTKRPYRRRRRLPSACKGVAAYRAGAHGISRASNTTVGSTVSATGYHRDRLWVSGPTATARTPRRPCLTSPRSWCLSSSPSPPSYSLCGDG
jgi:hypothetical protein